MRIKQTKLGFFLMVGNTVITKAVSKRHAESLIDSFNKGVKSKQVFHASIQNMAESELLSIVDKDILNEIKKVDPKPLIKAFCIGHEGIANSRILGAGSRVIQFFKGAVQKLFDVLQLNTKVFSGHGEGTNNHDGRNIVGRVIGKTVRKIGDSLHVIAAIYMEPGKDENFDIASIEAEAVFIPDGENIVAKDVEQVTGIALANGQHESPAFKNAKLLGVFQALREHKNTIGGNPMKTTVEELISAINEGGFKPSDLFTEEDLVSDDLVKKALSNLEKLSKTNHQAKKRIEENLGGKIDSLTEENTSLKEKNKSLEKQLLSGKVSTMFESISTDRKLSAKQKSFIEANLNSFSSDAENEEGMKQGLNTFIDQELKKAKTLFEQLGIKDDTSGKEDKDASGEASKNHQSPSSDGDGDKDYQNPEQNPFIPTYGEAKK